MVTLTDIYDFNLPLVGGDINLWGGYLNDNFTKLDDLFAGDLGFTPNLLTGWKVGGVAVTASAAKLNILTGVTSSAVELNLLDGLLATTADLNLLQGLAGAGLSGIELGYVNGVTSAIQTQLNGKQATITTLALGNGGTGAALADPNADRLMFWDDSAGAVAFASVSGLSFSGTTLVSSARVPLATKAAAASATIDFTEFNNAVYKWYEFEFEDLLPATDTAALRMRFSTNAGVGYDAGVSDYSYGNVTMEDGGTPQNDNSLGAAFINLHIGYSGGLGNAAGELGVSGTIKLYGAGSAASKTKVSGLLLAENSSGRLASSSVSGRRMTAQDTDAVRFLMSSGNITSGTIRMYGIVA